VSAGDGSGVAGLAGTSFTTTSDSVGSPPLGASASVSDVTGVSGSSWRGRGCDAEPPMSPRRASSVSAAARTLLLFTTGTNSYNFCISGSSRQEGPAARNVGCSSSGTRTCPQAMAPMYVSSTMTGTEKSTSPAWQRYRYGDPLIADCKPP
jgi:hypothetical protein